jgi:mxaJ protein
MRRSLAMALVGLGFVGLLAGPVGSAPPRRVLRVCADPNNLPFSSARRDGLEDRIARVLADELGAELHYTWWAQRRGFFRNTLKAGTCDVVIGVPRGHGMVATSKPYYRSTYAFVTRRGAVQPPIAGFSDARLRTLRVGVPLVGDDGANPPPVHALASRGVVTNVTGYTVFGHYADDPPTGAILAALERGELDVAIVWGPLAGWWARARAKVPLDVTPAADETDGPLPLAFDISLGVRRNDRALLSELEGALARRRAAIDQILADYGVPRR